MAQDFSYLPSQWMGTVEAFKAEIERDLEFTEQELDEMDALDFAFGAMRDARALQERDRDAA